MSIVKSEMLTVVAILVSLALIACGDAGNQIKQESEPEGQIHTSLLTSTPGPTATAAPVTSQATLPTLTLTRQGRTIEARRFEACWTPDSSSDLQCVETSPRGEQAHYAEVDSGDSIEIEITPESPPTRLIATIFTQPGEVMVGNLLHLSPVERELVVDMPPGRYNVRLHAQWFERWVRCRPSQGELRVWHHSIGRGGTEVRMHLDCTGRDPRDPAGVVGRS